jgi:predicted membrane-bound dolichyl-phosphate-mannose-protein mannosyltransferase
MTMKKNETTIIEAIEVLVSPTPRDKEIIEEAIKLLGIQGLLLNLEAYDISETTIEKLIDIRNIVEEFTVHLSDNTTDKGGGHNG